MEKNALLPERYKHQDFFIADIFDSLPIKNDRHTMEHPFFTLSTKKDVRVIKYNANGVNIVLSPSAQYGLPTMFDKDILLYCGSLFMAEINKGHTPPKKIRFSIHNLLITTNRMTNGQAYKQLKNAFERITGCLITTSIKTKEIKQTKGFHILESYEIIEKSHDNSRMVKVEVTLSDWFYNVLMAREVLTLNKDYFRLRKSLERRLYELGRKHCGKQKKWSIKLENLHHKTGSLSDLNKFRFQLRTIIENDERENHFPDYYITLSDKDDTVTFTQKQEQTGLVPKILLDYLSVKQAKNKKEYLSGVKPHVAQKAFELVKIMPPYQRLDFSIIVEEFAHYIKAKEKPKNMNTSFMGFVKKKIKNAI